MKSLSSLTLQSTIATVAFSVLLVVAVAGLCWVTWRRSGYRASVGLLELLRLATVALLAFLFNQPEWVEEFRPSEKPTLAILYDGSTSMETRDVGENPATAITRSAAAEPLLSTSAWQQLADQLDVVIEPFNRDPHRGQTDLSTPLLQTSEKYGNLRGIVLVSDGDWNTGAAPVQAAASLRLKGVPVFTAAVGSPNRLPDLELISLDAPTFAIANKSVRIPFTIESSLPREIVANVVLKISTGEEVSHEVRIAPMSRTSDALLWKPTTTGDVTATLTVPSQEGELLTDNNALTSPISIREEKLRVLVIESYPRWEYRYLRNALSRDPGVEVSCLLFHPGLSKVGGGNRDYIKEFPAQLEDLSKYDVVFLGDVGLEEGQLTAEHCHLLKGLVEHQASGLVLMPGWQGRQHSLENTEIADLMPVLLDGSQPGGWGSRSPGHFELTELGRRSLLTKLADTQDENIAVWESLPGFQWYAPALKPKPGAEVLAVHQEAANQWGRLPLLVTRTFGAGKVLYMGTDGAWRWRKGVEDKYHYRFWGQVVRWMAYQRNMAKGESMRLYYSPEQPSLKQTLTLNANVMESSGEPLSRGEVSVKVVSPSGETQVVRMTSTGAEWGAFNGKFTPTEPGKHQLTLTCRETSASLEASLYVQGVASERLGRPARPEVLEEISRVTRGKVLKLDQLEEAVKLIAELPEPPPIIRRLQLWCHPLMGLFVLLLLGGFWIGRKAAGLI